MGRIQSTVILQKIYSITFQKNSKCYIWRNIAKYYVKLANDWNLTAWAKTTHGDKNSEQLLHWTTLWQDICQEKLDGCRVKKSCN